MGLPKTRDGWVALAIGVALAALGTWQATEGNWIATVMAALGAVGAAIGVGVKLGGKPGLPPMSLLLCAFGLAATACNPHAAAKRSTFAGMQAVQLAGDSLGRLAKAAHGKCIAKHAKATEGYRTCIKPWRERLLRWKIHIRPAGRSGVAALYGAVRLADATKGKGKKLKWMPLFEIIGCTIFRGIQEWGHLMADGGQEVLALLAALDPSVCKPPAPVPRAMASPGAVAAGLGIALEIVRWLRQALIDPADELFAAVDAWLKAPAKDESDAAAILIHFNWGLPADVPPRP